MGFDIFLRVIPLIVTEIILGVSPSSAERWKQPSVDINIMRVPLEAPIDMLNRAKNWLM
jgi:hypothetical protein